MTAGPGRRGAARSDHVYGYSSSHRRTWPGPRLVQMFAKSPRGIDSGTTFRTRRVRCAEMSARRANVGPRPDERPVRCPRCGVHRNAVVSTVLPMPTNGCSSNPPVLKVANRGKTSNRPASTAVARLSSESPTAGARSLPSARRQWLDRFRWLLHTPQWSPCVQFRPTLPI